MAKHPLTAQPSVDDSRLLERAAKLADIRDRMMSCLEELDRLDLPYAANYRSHAIALVDKET